VTGSHSSHSPVHGQKTRLPGTQGGSHGGKTPLASQICVTPLQSRVSPGVQ
jgi:hypothetical protein